MKRIHKRTKRILKKTMVDAIGLVGSFPTSVTRKDDLAALIHSLRPVSPGVDLIRLGPAGDGGYLVPDDLAGIEACFSPGVADISGFERGCADLGMQVFLADGSVDEPPDSHDRFAFTKKYIGATTCSEFMTVDDWVSASLPGSTEELLLQIDIEGYEYEAFLSLSDDLMRRFRVIVAEFHLLDALWSRPFFSIASRVFQKILQTHSCVHLHPNNVSGSLAKHKLTIPQTMEFTFLRSDRVRGTSFATAFPHPLDDDNTDNPPLILPKCWYQAT